MKLRVKRESEALHRRREVGDPIVIRHCHGNPEFEACIRLERAVWKSDDIDVVPVPLFVVASQTGGHVLGAFDGSKLIGFTLAFAGWRDRTPLLHSHMTAVSPRYQDRGIGRRLKLFQRDDALMRGIDLIEWTVDPLVIKNAYFNLMRLGAIARRYIPNAYGRTTSPLHGGLPTDRLVAEWHLRSSRVLRVLGKTRHTPNPAKDVVRIAIPSAYERWKTINPVEAKRTQSKVRSEFLKWFAEGFAATGVAQVKSGIEYILEPWSNT